MHIYCTIIVKTSRYILYIHNIIYNILVYFTIIIKSSQLTIISFLIDISYILPIIANIE
jgi:hypothetical protein